MRKNVQKTKFEAAEMILDTWNEQLVGLVLTLNESLILTILRTWNHGGFCVTLFLSMYYLVPSFEMATYVFTFFFTI